MPKKIPLFEIYTDRDDENAVREVICRGKYWADGPELGLFENKITEYVGSKYALVFNSGTSALHACLLSHGIGEGDEVIVPSFTFISTVNTILMVGGKPVFADIEEKSYGLDPESVENKITAKTKAILPVHYGGAPCNKINSLKELAQEKKILLLEDAAEALGSKHHGINVGTFGDSAMFSFCQNKVISTGEGGAIMTDSSTIYNRLKLIRSHGRREAGESYFSTHRPQRYIQMGYNYRMPTMCAALGLSQLEKIEKIIAKRRRVAKKYDKKLSNIGFIKTSKPEKGIRHIYQMYTIETKGIDRDKLQEFLWGKGIMTKVYFPPVHLEPFYRELLSTKEDNLPVTESLSNRVLTLPMYPHLPDEDIDYIAESLQKYQEE